MLVAGLPLQLTNALPGRAAMLMWIPIAVFEITVALWFLFKGVAQEKS
jgi:hypothetical protein